MLDQKRIFLKKKNIIKKLGVKRSNVQNVQGQHWRLIMQLRVAISEAFKMKLDCRMKNEHVLKA